MAKKHNALGKDFYSILDDNILGMKGGTATTLRIAEIEPRSDQPRQYFDKEALEALAESIATYGVLQPILVRPNPDFEGCYEIIAGERRWRAAKLALLTEIPAIVLDGDDLETAEIALIENVQRRDLNAVEEALAYRDLIERFQLTQEAVAARVGKSRPAIANMMRLLELPESVLSLVAEGTLSAGHARTLLGLTDRENIPALAERILAEDLSVRATEQAVKRLNTAPATPLPDVTGHVQSRTWMKDLERRTRERLGRKVKITQNAKKHSVEIFYDDNADMEALLTAICGEGLFAEEE